MNICIDIPGGFKLDIPQRATVTLYRGVDIQTLLQEAEAASNAAIAAAAAIADKAPLRSRFNEGVINASDQFQIPSYPSNVQNNIVYINGLQTHPNDYTVSGSGLVSITYPTEGQNITVLTLFIDI